ncbi:MAG: pyrroloquinoline quinone-dependent dehydrogenase [Deltaproteobacteria bacterium]|nr:pyrroloquinoline quinone-dependent dehydrogenase [Deltaproteobacteria bacterium]MBW2361467.1 pyrroloquinoline quinone-dependent dehydrogenase [Deltaproteobacteria bacterium]
MSSSSKGRATWWVIAGLAAFTIACENAPAPSFGGGSIATWTAYGGTPGGTHYSTAEQITPENVQWLELAWEHRSGDIRKAQGPGEGRIPVTNNGFQATPIVIDDTLYYCSSFNKVFAIHAETGAEKWRFDAEVDRYADILPVCRGVSSWRSGKEGICEHRILMGTLDARLIALDAETGLRCMDFGEGGEVDVTHRLSKHQPVEYSITSPPAILNDLAITGSLVLDNQRTDAPSGVVRAYDVRSGELRWAWNPVPPGTEKLNEDGTYRSGTTNVWSIIAVDEERDLVFVPTGNTNPDYYGGHRDGLDHYSSSVVALNGKTGEVVWHFQMVHHDLWDYDTPAQPTLMDLRLGDETIPVVVQVTKMGMTFVLHRETGEPVFPVEERPVPQDPVPGEYLSPTQPFPTHIPHLLPPITSDDAWGFTFLDEGACRDKLNDVRNDGIFTPPSLGGSLLYPSNGGGNNWGSPAIHLGEQIMLVVTWRLPATSKLVPREDCGDNFQPQHGTPYCVETGLVFSPVGVPCTAPPWGTLDAIDLAAGEIRWSVPLGTAKKLAPFPFSLIKGVPGVGGPTVTSTGLVFIGASTDHMLRAHDLADGKVLWKTTLPTAANAVPMTYQVRPGGRQYVVVAAGGHWGSPNPPGDHLMAFALPE